MAIILYFRKRDKVERRAAYRKWPLPANQGPLRRNTSHTRRSVTLPCIIYIFLIGASMYMLLLIAFFSNLTTNNVISLYKGWISKDDMKRSLVL